MLSSSQELKLKPMSHRPAALEAPPDILRFEDQTSVLRCFVKAMRFAQCCAVAPCPPPRASLAVSETYRKPPCTPSTPLGVNMSNPKYYHYDGYG